LQTASGESPTVSLAANLAGTAEFRDLIDAAARAVDDVNLDLSAGVDAVAAPLARADLSCTVTTLQGPIRLSDYLQTRCVEAVVHARDFIEPVRIDPDALAIAAHALSAVVERDHPGSLAFVRAMPELTWVEVAAGRAAPPDELRRVAPVLR
jgi:Mycothiol maleylpyruvate isomerase N-terminal domain